jgi:hypothetical protein
MVPVLFILHVLVLLISQLSSWPRWNCAACFRGSTRTFIIHSMLAMASFFRVTVCKFFTLFKFTIWPEFRKINTREQQYSYPQIFCIGLKVEPTMIQFNLNHVNRKTSSVKKYNCSLIMCQHCLLHFIFSFRSVLNEEQYTPFDSHSLMCTFVCIAVDNYTD